MTGFMRAMESVKVIRCIVYFLLLRALNCRLRYKLEMLGPDNVIHQLISTKNILEIFPAVSC